MHLWLRSLQRLLLRSDRMRQHRRRPPSTLPPRRLQLEMLENRLLLAVFTVTNTSDSPIVNSGSLRAAILNANATPGLDTIQFNIPGSGVQTISPTSALPTITDPVIIDGYSQPGASPNTLAGGDNAVLHIELSGASAGTGVDGLHITAGNSTVRGLVINGFLQSLGGGFGNGIVLDTGGGDVIEGNFIGTNPSGTAAVSNGHDGVLVNNSANNLIGGNTPAARNVIGANALSVQFGAGILIQGNGATGNLLEGNFIGTDRTGKSALGNSEGVTIESPGNTVGGTSAAARNVISGNFDNGIVIDSATNVVQENFIGTDVTGSAMLGNSNAGVVITNAPSNTIGGTAAGAGNVISGNGGGVEIDDNTAGGQTATGNLVQGNFIGTDVTGTMALGNSGFGVAISGASSNVIGGTTTAARNLISGNGSKFGQGIQIRINGGASATGNVIEGNYIGTDVTGGSALPNVGDGLDITSNNTTIGGTAAGAGNVISFNTGDGVEIAGSGNEVEGNSIALNGSVGVGVGGGTGNSILANSIFSNAKLGIDLGNDGVTPNTPGGPHSGPNNLQNFPVLTSVLPAGSGTVINGTLNSTANHTFRIEFFNNAAPDPSGFGQGQRFLGFVNVTTDTSGNASFSFTSTTAAAIVSTTATDTTTNDTSEFSHVFVNPLVVTTSADETNPNDNLTSLREAITFANTNPGTDTITFRIPGSGVHTISPTDALPTVTDPVVIDGYSQPGASPNTLAQGDNAVLLIELDGSNTPSRGSFGAADGLLLTAGNSTVKGLVINRFGLDAQIALATNGGNTIEGNFLGTDASGTVGVGNSIGVDAISIQSTSDNTIGGATAGARNLISGNFEGIGIFLGLSNPTRNVVQGNFIGTDVTGTKALGNSTYGVRLVDAPDNTIGGTTVTTRNVIASNGGDQVILIRSPRTLVQGNFIGTDVTGNIAMGSPTGLGIAIGGGSSNETIGGATAGAGNVISGNGSAGLQLGGDAGDLVQGNFIGTNAAGTSILGNQQGIEDFNNRGTNTIGGTTAAARNIISGNTFSGIDIESGTSGQVVQGNFIGTDVTGTIALSNGGDGLTCNNPNNSIGGTTPGGGNVISGNGGNGLQIIRTNSFDTGGLDNVVQGNFIGTDFTGSKALANLREGLFLDGAGRTTIGGISPGAGNVISGNNGHGVMIANNTLNANNPALATGNVVQGNFIGTDVSGASSLGNSLGGVALSADNNFIGGTLTATRNIISGNGGKGIMIGFAHNNQVQGNFIGTNAAGTGALGNGGAGILVINGGGSNTIGGTTSGAGNTIAFNSAAGVGLEPTAGTGNSILANSIFANAKLGIDLGTSGVPLMNTPGGPHSGPNDLQNFPVLTSVTVASGTTTVQGTLNSSPSSPFRIEVFGNNSADPTGFGQGQRFLGFASVSTDSSGNASFTVTIPGQNLGPIFSTTATDTSRGDTSEFSFDFEGPSLVVTTAADETANDFKTSLREAINFANTMPGIKTITFNIPGQGVQTIKPASPLPALTAPVIIDGYSEPGASPNTNGPGLGDNAVLRIELNGSLLGPGVNGLRIDAGGSTVQGLAINRFAGNGNVQLIGAILLDNQGGNVIEGNFLGTDATGMAAPGNLRGVMILGSSNNTIGGTSAGARNIISGNSHIGVDIFEGATGNILEGNFVGSDATGTTALGNALAGVFINNSPGNRVGGTTAAARNLISGNRLQGISIAGGAGATANVVEGNYIGTDVTGTHALGNPTQGVNISQSARNNTVGGVAAGAGNLISGNGGEGILIAGSGTTGNLVQGNFIGVDKSGSMPLGNHIGVSLDAANNTIGGTAAGAGNIISSNIGGIELTSGATGIAIEGNLIGTDSTGTVSKGNIDAGILVTDSNNNQIGGIAAGAGNVISGNGQAGIGLVGTSTANLVQGNFIGTDKTGKAALGNNLAGIDIAAPGNTIGGTTTAARNIISGGAAEGVAIHDSIAIGNVVEGNFIGLDVTGSAILGNSTGVFIDNASSNTVGGTATAANNVISGNNASGVLVEGTSAGNLVLGNLIGTDAAGLVGLGNKERGVFLASSGTTVGGTTPAARNIIAGNVDLGVLIDGASATGNQVLGNFIGVNKNGAALGNQAGGVGISDDGNPANNVSANLISGNVISANNGHGVLIVGAGAKSNQVQGNFIGTDAAGSAGLGNKEAGVAIENNSAGNTIGGTAAGAGNVISGNTGNGIFVTGGNGNLILGNFVGANPAGTSILANQQNGILIQGSGNTIGGSGASARNIISGNGNDGVFISFSGGSTSAGNVIQGNFIGTDSTGNTKLGNQVDGIGVAGSNTAIGGTLAGVANVISGNKRDGIRISGSATLVQGNFIGTNSTATGSLGNGMAGIDLVDGATNNTVGGTTSAASNLISGNGADGISLISSSEGTTRNNLIEGNFIGTDGTGSAPLGNGGSGVHISAGSGNTIGGTSSAAGNIIAFNGAAGVTVDDGSRPAGTAVGNSILGNSIFSNAKLGIDLGGDGVTPNDSKGHVGPNNYQNFPVLTSATTSVGGTTIQGTLSSTPNTSITVELFANAAMDPSGFGQGQTFLFRITLTTDAAGSAGFTVVVATRVPGGQFITATATDPGNTSEFSKALPVQAVAVLTLTLVPVCAVEAVPLNNVTVATFTDAMPQPVSNYTATINWGDGTAPSSGTITIAGQTFKVLGSHAYGSEGSYIVSITVQPNGGNPVTKTTTATVGGFVTSLYEKVLNRLPDAPGLTFWVQQLHGGVSRDQISFGFWVSPEHRGLEVDQFYQTFFSRLADAAGRSYWVNMLLAGVSETEVAIDFLDSPEYTFHHPDSPTYVEGLHEDVLGRHATMMELDFWVGVLQSGARTRAALAYYTLTSDESLLKAIDDYYLEFLGRARDVFGQEVYFAAMKDGRLTPPSIVALFLGSKEFLDREIASACQMMST